MRSAAEEFAIQLGRASRRSMRYLRWTPAQDRDDVIASAMLAAWEDRANYKGAAQSLEDWFGAHVKTAANLSKREEHHRKKGVSLTALQDMQSEPYTETVERELETAEAAAQTLASLNDIERQVASMLASGESMRAIRSATGASVTRRMFAKLRRLQALLPDEAITRSRARGAAASPDEADGRMAPIDHEIERMLRRPATERADCPVCFRCCWFDGVKPKNYAKPRHIKDADVLQAVADTEARKIRIANGERL